LLRRVAPRNDEKLRFLDVPSNMKESLKGEATKKTLENKAMWDGIIQLFDDPQRS
jgi:hypothetical protein